MEIRYLVRVELVDLKPSQDSWEMYEMVHEAMERDGFLRTWSASERVLQLPDATYLGNRQETEAIEVAKAVNARIKTLSLQCRALVCKAPLGSLGSMGLDPA